MSTQFEQDCVDMKVDVGVLKQQVMTLTQLCNKMDIVIDKLMDNHTQSINQVYMDMDRRKQETNADIKDLHSRITNVDRNLSDKIELTERRIMEELKAFREDISQHNLKEDTDLKKILEWKWMAAGGIIVIAWILSHVSFGSILGKLFG
jgi:hypothetical protein